MTKVYPPLGFENSVLQIHAVPVGDKFGRIYLAKYPNPLGVGKTPSRFSDPRQMNEADRFGVLYLGATTKVCFLEAVLRDQRDGTIGMLPISESILHDRVFAEIEVTSPLQMVDLRDDSAIKMGVPTDVGKATEQELAREWSAAFHEHANKPDGIIYPSRLNNQTNLAVFDRAISKLSEVRRMKLIDAPGFTDMLDDFEIGIVTPDV